MPLVGAVAGGLAGCAGWFASLALPSNVAAAVAFAAGAVVTGAIHLDGFLDGCDAFFASVAPERRLEILKDPHHGTFAVAGMFVAGALWLGALRALAPRTYPAVLAFAGALARAAAVSNAFVFRYAPAGTPTRALATRPPLAPFVGELLLLALAGSRIAPRAAYLIPVAIAVALILGGCIARRLGGGLVGDAYGFSIVLLEIAILVAIVALRDAR